MPEEIDFFEDLRNFISKAVGKRRLRRRDLRKFLITHKNLSPEKAKQVVRKFMDKHINENDPHGRGCFLI